MTQLWQQAHNELKGNPLAQQRFYYVTWGYESFPQEAKAHWVGQPDKQGRILQPGR